MSVMAGQITVIGPVLLVMCGATLISRHPVSQLRHLGVLVLGMMIWVVLWLLAARQIDVPSWAVRVAWAGWPPAWQELTWSLVPAIIGYVPALLAAWLAAPRRAGSHMGLGLVALALYGALVVPMLGRGGTWPWPSVVLCLTGLLLAAGLARVISGRVQGDDRAL